MSLLFHVVDSLTGKIAGRLYPNAWEWTDPITGNGSGTLTLPLPEPERVGAMLAMTRPRVRWVAVEERTETGAAIVFGGPISRRPGRDGDTVTVPFLDWRGWLYHRYLSELCGVPDLAGGYVTKNAEQVLAMRKLMHYALTDSEAPVPYMVVDDCPATDVIREVTFRSYQTSIGDCLDDLASRADAPEWYSYITRIDDRTLLPHLAVAYPERSDKLIRVEHRLAFEGGHGGNVAEYAWPEGTDAPTRVWATGDGEPPAQPAAYDQLPELEEGADLVWEDVENISGVTEVPTLFDHAQDNLDALSNLSGQATFKVPAEPSPNIAHISLGEVNVGDRAVLVLRDGWEDLDLPGVRIIQRVVTGGRDQPLMQELTLDLTDPEPPGDAEPGVEGIDEEIA